MEGYEKETRSFEGACCPLPQTKFFCPRCGEYSWLVKLAIFFHAAMTLAITVTLILLCLSVNRDSVNLAKHMETSLAHYDKEMEGINAAMRTTMDNRAIQTEIRGLLGAWIAERRRMESDKK